MHAHMRVMMAVGIACACGDDDGSFGEADTDASAGESSPTADSADAGGDHEDGSTGSQESGSDDGGESTTEGEDSIDPQTLFSAIEADLHAEVATLIAVRWEQSHASQASWLEFREAEGSWRASPERAVTPDSGSGSGWIAGVPAETQLEYRVVARIDDQEYRSEVGVATTGALPVDLPHATFEGELEEGQFLALSVEATESINAYFSGPYWLLIVDHTGRVVWYRQRTDSETTAFELKALPQGVVSGERRAEGGVLVTEHADATRRGLRAVSLDGGIDQVLELEDFDRAYEVTDEGAVIYAALGFGDIGNLEAAGVYEYLDGEIRVLWDCLAWAREQAGPEVTIDRSWCQVDSLDWRAADASLLLTLPDKDSILQLDTAGGTIVQTFGGLNPTWTFDPPELGLVRPRDARWSAMGGLLVSTHLPGSMAPDGHRFIEFEVDDGASTLREGWSHGQGTGEYGLFGGAVGELEGGDVVVNYGSGGSLRALGRDGSERWQLRFDVDWSIDFHNLMLGQSFLTDDLYSLLRTPQE